MKLAKANEDHFQFHGGLTKNEEKKKSLLEEHYFQFHGGLTKPFFA